MKLFDEDEIRQIERNIGQRRYETIQWILPRLLWVSLIVAQVKFESTFFFTFSFLYLISFDTKQFSTAKISFCSLKQYYLSRWPAISLLICGEAFSIKLSVLQKINVLHGLDTLSPVPQFYVSIRARNLWGKLINDFFMNKLSQSAVEKESNLAVFVPRVQHFNTEIKTKRPKTGKSNLTRDSCMTINRTKSFTVVSNWLPWLRRKFSLGDFAKQQLHLHGNNMQYCLF